MSLRGRGRLAERTIPAYAHGAHTVGMPGPLKTWMVAAIAVAVLLVAALPALAVTLASSDGDGTGRGQGAGHGQGWKKHVEKKKADKQTEPPGKARGRHGPGSAWKALTPAQKAKKMAELSREHADAMQKWAACVAAGRDDCERPVPPGHAKRG
jgi:hypothetical protein